MPISESPVSGKRERNKAEKQRRIIATARDLFDSNGFEATTMAQISERAEIGTGTLYLYFQSKEELLVEVFSEEVSRAWQDALDHIDRSQALLEQLLQAFGEVSEFHLGDRELAQSYFKELAFLPEDTRGPATDFMRRFYDRLTALLTDAQDADKLRPDVPVGALARNLFAIWYHLMLRTFTNRLTPDKVHERLHSSFSVALLGLTPGE